jgi:hypothetical protein
VWLRPALWKAREEFQLGPSKFAALAKAIDELVVVVTVEHCDVEPAEAPLYLDDGLASTYHTVIAPAGMQSPTRL